MLSNMSPDYKFDPVKDSTSPHKSYFLYTPLIITAATSYYFFQADIYDMVIVETYRLMMITTLFSIIMIGYTTKLNFKAQSLQYYKFPFMIFDFVLCTVMST